MLSMTLTKVKRNGLQRNRYGIEAKMWDGAITLGWLDYDIRKDSFCITEIYVRPEYRRLKVGWCIVDYLKDRLMAQKRRKRIEMRLPHTREFTNASYFLSDRPGCCGFSSVLDGDSVVFTWEEQAP